MSPSPTGINQPAAPKAKRVRRSAQIAVAAMVALVLGLIVFGIARTSQRRALAASGSSVKILPASEAAKEIHPPQRPSPLAGAGTLQMPPQQQQPPAVPSVAPGELVAPAQLPRGYGAVAPQPQAFQYQQPPFSAAPAKTAEQVALEDAYRQEQEAMRAPAVLSSWTGIGAQGTAAPVPVSALPGTPGGGNTGVTSAVNQNQQQQTAGGGAGEGAAVDRNGVKGFLETGKAASRQTYQVGARVAPASPYEIKAGWKIPAILEQELNSDLPGEITALVSSHVYDTATGRYLLIPQGARLVGSYRGETTYGQSRIAAEFSRLIYPDASSQVIDGMAAHSTEGSAGLHDRVDRHYARLIGMGLLTSLFSATSAISTNRGATGQYGYLTPSQAASQAVGLQMSQLGIEVTRKNLNVTPTIHVRSGYPFDVFVAKDMVFEEAYGRLTARKQ